MVICLIRVNSKSRNIFHLSSSILLVFIIFVIICTGYQKATRILEYHRNGMLDKLKKFEPFYEVSMFVSLGLSVACLIILSYVLDTVISQKDSKQRCSVGSHSTSSLLIVFSFFICWLSLIVSIKEANEFDEKMKKIIVMVLRLSDNLDERYFKMFCQKYTNYSTSPKDRQFIDQIQTEYSCCGVTSMTDFLDLSEVEGFEMEFAPQTQLFQCNSWEYCSVPLSCCKSTMCSQKVQLLRASVDLAAILPKWFHQNGCVEAMHGSMLGISKLWFPVILLLASFLLHFPAVILTQIVMTSFASLNDSTSSDLEESFGWLFDFGYPGARDLVETNEKASEKKLKIESSKQQLGSSTETENGQKGELLHELVAETKRDVEKKEDVGLLEETKKELRNGLIATNLSASSSENNLKPEPQRLKLSALEKSVILEKDDEEEEDEEEGESDESDNTGNGNGLKVLKNKDKGGKAKNGAKKSKNGKKDKEKAGKKKGKKQGKKKGKKSTSKANGGNKKQPKGGNKKKVTTKKTKTKKK